MALMVDTWSVEQVSLWLQKEGFAAYVSEFLDNGVDGRTLLDLTPEDLKDELEIPLALDRKNMYSAIQRLRQAPASQPQPPQQAPLLGTPPSFEQPTNRGGPGFSTNSKSTILALPPRQTPSAARIVFCCKCGQKCEGHTVRALDRDWHAGCFCCDFCHNRIRDVEYAADKDKPYHPDCLAAMQGDICRKCMKIISGTVTLALGKKFHPECFCCKGCSKPILETTFFVEPNDSAYHAACKPGHGDVSDGHPACAGCQGPISFGVTVTALGKYYHKGCFKCGVCHQLITGDLFRAQGELPVHINCAGGPGAAKCGSQPAALCPGCHKGVVSGEVTFAMEKVWHSACFTCKVCGQRITSDKFSLLGADPVHMQCRR